MIGRLAACTQAIDQAMAQYRYNDAASALYRCIWNEFCDWYVEFTKPIIQGDDENLKAETRACTAWVLGQLLHLLHPFMPYITEELWPQLGEGNTRLLIGEPWPDFSALAIDAEAGADLDWVIRLVSEIRTLRAEMNVPPGAQIPIMLRDANDRTQTRLSAYGDLVRRLARIDRIDLLSGDGPKGAAQIVIDEATVLLPLAGIIDVDKERARLKKDLDKAAGEAEKIAKKLGNAQFVAKADPEVVEEQRLRLVEIEQMQGKLQQALDRLAVI
jgi:valyl-tRNA synthetase